MFNITKKNNLINFAEPTIDVSLTLKMLKKALKNNFPGEGDLVKIFEKKISKLLKVKYVLTCTNGTSSIFLALKSLGLKAGDEVLIPNITFQATANAVRLTGAKPVLVDVLPDNLLMDPNDLKKKINKHSKAIIPVHVSGRGANIKNILKIAKKNKLFLVEDAAEAFMSKFEKKYLGTYGDIGCYSFAPNKIITTGQGGIVVTNKRKIYQSLIKLKDQGRNQKKKSIEHQYLMEGFNFKFTNLQAALGISQLNTLKKRIQILKNNYKFYQKNILYQKNIKIFNFNLKKGELPLWVDIKCDNRVKLYNFLKNKKILCRFFWKPLNLTIPYKQSFGSLRNSKKLQNKLMWLPSSLSMSAVDIKYVCDQINNFLKLK
jgi:perosamine synthetase